VNKQVLSAILASFGYVVPFALLFLAWPYLFGVFYPVACLLALYIAYQYDSFVERIYENADQAG
jgi:hypothetical protein